MSRRPLLPAIRVVSGVLCFTCWWALRAAAQPSAPEPIAVEPIAEQSARAQDLFREALSLARQHRYDEACPRFEESLRLEPKSGSAYNLARCYEKQDRLASAWTKYREAAELARTERKPARVRLAEQGAEALSPRLSTLTIKVSEPRQVPDLTILHNGHIIAPPLWGSAVPVDGGVHFVEARAPGYQSYATKIELRSERAAEVVTIPPLVEEPLTAVPVPLPPPPPSLAPAPEPLPRQAAPTEEHREPSILGPVLVFGGFGVGVAGLVVGTITGAVSWSRTAELEDACQQDWCHPGLADDLETTRELATASNIGFGIGAVGIAAGLIGLLVYESTAEGDSAMEVAVGAEGFTLRRRF